MSDNEGEMPITNQPTSESVIASQPVSAEDVELEEEKKKRENLTDNGIYYTDSGVDEGCLACLLCCGCCDCNDHGDSTDKGCCDDGGCADCNCDCCGDCDCDGCDGCDLACCGD